MAPDGGSSALRLDFRASVHRISRSLASEVMALNSLSWDVHYESNYFDACSDLEQGRDYWCYRSRESSSVIAGSDGRKRPREGARQLMHAEMLCNRIKTSLTAWVYSVEHLRDHCPYTLPMDCRQMHD